MLREFRGNPMEVSAKFAQADRQGSFRSHSSGGQKASGKHDALCSSEQGHVLRLEDARN